jgi:multicomponent Na+:H+ antiporter subunit D
MALLDGLPPFLPYFIGAAFLPFLPKSLRAWFFLLPPVAVLGILAGLTEGTHLTLPFVIWELQLLRVDRLALLFGWIFAIATFLGGVYALHLKDTGQQVSALLYSGSALGAVFAGDLLSLFLFWEVMAVTSAYLVWARRTERSRQAGLRYLYVHLFGGSVLLAGILLHWTGTGSMAFETFAVQNLATWLILIGFALNAAVPPLHGWLPDAYPEATITGAVFMSAFTTKTAVYTLARGFEGWDILIPAGVIMALWGVTYAVLANDVRRLLGYHIVSQVGFMVTGIGFGSEMALNGATGHAFTHILYKGLLFMGAGVLIHATGRSKLTELGGLARLMPWTVVLYMIAAFSISGFPLFSGFVSKAITLDAGALLYQDTAVFLLYLASVGTFLSVGLKLPYMAWWGGKETPSAPLNPIPWNMIAAMALAAGLNIWIGISPSGLYSILPYPLDYEPYTWKHLTKSAQMLGFIFLAFWLLRNKLTVDDTLVLDTDWVYRRPARWSYGAGPMVVAAAFGAVQRGVQRVVSEVVRVGSDPVGWMSGAAKSGTGSNSSSASFRMSFTLGGGLAVLTLLGLFLYLLLLGSGAR